MMRPPSAAVAGKRGEVEPEDLSGNLIVQLGVVTEDLNRRWYEANTKQVITDVQKRIHHPGLRWMAATLTAEWSPVGRCSNKIHVAVVILGGRGCRKIRSANST